MSLTLVEHVPHQPCSSRLSRCLVGIRCSPLLLGPGCRKEEVEELLNGRANETPGSCPPLILVLLVLPWSSSLPNTDLPSVQQTSLLSSLPR